MTAPAATTESAPAVGDRFELEVDRVAKGGAALGRAPDGRVVFCDGAIPGELVEAEAIRVHRSRLEAKAVAVLRPSPDRVEAPCAMVAKGCGGCDWQHIAPLAQSRFRKDIVADSLRRLAKMEDVDIRIGPVLDPLGYRTTVRAAVVDGRAGYRAGGSHDRVAVDECKIAHPLVEEVLVEGRFGSAKEATIRVGANTGERIVVVDQGAKSVAVPADVSVTGPGRGDLGQLHYHERLAGLRLQISAESFFQCRPDGAEVLAQLAGDAIADQPGSLLDAYCGVGLFGALLGLGREVIGVESNAVAAHDATHNYGLGSRVVVGRFEDWSPEPVGVAIADPARAGLKAAGCDKLAASGAAVIALISCDPAALARDARLLADRGYAIDHVVVVDLFGNTSHVETVSRFVRR